jgi:single-strand DNA-binding protein
MPALNQVQLIGHLGKDPETRFTPTGKKVCQFTIAVNRTWRSGEGEEKEATDWFNIEAWGRLGEVCQQYLSKGRLIYIGGRLRTDRWTDDKNETHYRTKVVARQMQMLDRKPDEQDVAAEGEEAES